MNRKSLVINVAGWSVLVSVAMLLACGVVADAKPPKRLGAAAPPHRVGITLGTNDAGMPVDDAGQVSIALDGGVPSVLGNPAVDHCVITSVSIDPPTGAFLARVVCGPYPLTVQGTLTAAQLGAVYNLVKAAAAAGGIQ